MCNFNDTVIDIKSQQPKIKGGGKFITWYFPLKMNHNIYIAI